MKLLLGRDSTTPRPYVTLHSSTQHSLEASQLPRWLLLRLPKGAARFDLLDLDTTTAISRRTRRSATTTTRRTRFSTTLQSWVPMNSEVFQPKLLAALLIRSSTSSSSSIFLTLKARQWCHRLTCFMPPPIIFRLLSMASTVTWSTATIRARDINLVSYLVIVDLGEFFLMCYYNYSKFFWDRTSSVESCSRAFPRRYNQEH